MTDVIPTQKHNLQMIINNNFKTIYFSKLYQNNSSFYYIFKDILVTARKMGQNRMHSNNSKTQAEQNYFLLKLAH